VAANNIGWNDDGIYIRHPLWLYYFKAPDLGILSKT